MSDEPNTGALAVPQAAPAASPVSMVEIAANLALVAVIGWAAFFGPPSGPYPWPVALALGLFDLAALASLADLIARYRKGLPHSMARRLLMLGVGFVCAVIFWLYSDMPGLFDPPLSPSARSIIGYVALALGLFFLWEARKLFHHFKALVGAGQ